MSRTLVIGDIHGGLKALHQILERAEVTTNDKLVFLGDYIDGWSDSPRVIDFLIELDKTHDCFFIRGNHEEMVLRWLTAGDDNAEWRIHGGQSTVDAYQDLDIHTKDRHVGFLARLNDYYIDEQNRLYVHAGFTNQKGVYYEFFRGMFCWDRTLWETAMSLNPALSKDDLFYPKRLTLYKEIFIGHTPVTRISETVPVNKANVWNVDTGAAFKGRLSIMDVDTKAFWQSDPLHELYANEKGRN
ncbi:serine/threonine protein phosphatase [Flavobacterium supellecticarium]|uniref:Serine/threonine protein phosphatase n=1 Tax=Flavobacterium supellecticarium TaxID=2565924 RepID=A0A4S3ZRA5_9FLAO|nr:metallophosphoesterase family protein [Flavobacterium supellecticarium]THF48136.1 serine/threonine protein phosphatase [Flavobacterium supellecticarium]